MAKVFIPIGYHLVVLLDEISEKRGSLYVPDSVRDKEQKAGVVGTVIAVGSGCFDYDKTGTVDVQVGDKVVFARYGGMDLPDINEDGKVFRALNDQDLIAKVVSE